MFHLIEGCCTFQFEQTQFTMKKPNFRCTLKTKNSPTAIEIIGRYIILILPHVKNLCYRIMALSLNDDLSNKKIKCRVNPDSIPHEIILPISDFHDCYEKYGLIPFPVNNLIFTFEDLDFKTIPKQEIPNNTRSTPASPVDYMDNFFGFRPYNDTFTPSSSFNPFDFFVSRGSH
jgi:hypothetical protein